MINPETPENTTNTAAGTTADFYYTTRLDAPVAPIVKSNPNRRHILEGHNVIEKYKGVGRKVNEAVLDQIARQQQELERRRWERNILQAADAVSAELRPTKKSAYEYLDQDKVKLTEENFSEFNEPIVESNDAVPGEVKSYINREPGPLKQFIQRAMKNPVFKRACLTVIALSTFITLSGCSNETSTDETTAITETDGSAPEATQTPEEENTQEKIGIIDGYGEAGMYLSEGKSSPLNFARASEVAEACGSADPREIVKYVAKNQVEALASYLVNLPEKMQPEGIKGLSLKSAEEYLESISNEEYDQILQQFNEIMDQATVSFDEAIGLYITPYMTATPESVIASFKNLSEEELTSCFMSLPEGEQSKFISGGVLRDGAINNIMHLSPRNLNRLLIEQYNKGTIAGPTRKDIGVVYTETSKYNLVTTFTFKNEDSIIGHMQVNLTPEELDEDGNVVSYGEDGNCVQPLTPSDPDGTPSIYVDTPVVTDPETPTPEWGKSGDPHGGEDVEISDQVDPESEVSEEQNNSTNTGNQGYVDDHGATPGSASDVNGTDSYGFADSGILATDADTDDGRLLGGENQAANEDGSSTMAGENAYQNPEAIAEGEAIDEAGNNAQAEAQESGGSDNEGSTPGGDNYSDEDEEGIVAGGDF
ncbi:hypothetical protein J6X73_02900 [Candidatus Saccharibacteria bacterium]|nr:hypothetical protein [Candidatus Saccharibacteria bacterium]